MGATMGMGVTCVQSRAAHVMTSHAALAHKKKKKKKKWRKVFRPPPPHPVCFCWGEKLPVVRSCGCSASVAFSALVQRRECEFLAVVKLESELSSLGYSAVRPLARSLKSHRPSPFHLCRLASQRASSAASELTARQR